MDHTTRQPPARRGQAAGAARPGSSPVSVAPSNEATSSSEHSEAASADGDATWKMFRVRADSPSSDTSSLLGAWDDLAERERDLDIAVGQPLLLPPAGWPDRDVLAYLTSGRFRWLAPQTQSSYATDLKVHLNFLASQKMDWRHSTVETFIDYENWRLRDSRNPGRVVGATFSRELAALRHFYEFQVRRGVIERSPADVRLRPSNVRRYRVKWLTPRAYRRWRDVGLAGYRADYLPDASWRGRNATRNTAFADLLWSSGLRLHEAATLLTLELPASFGGGFVRGRVGESVAKGSGRDFFVAERALRGIEGYRDSTRAAAVRRAQRDGRYADIDGVMVAEAVTRNRQVVLADNGGRRGRGSLDAMSAEDRRRLFVEGDGGLEPAMLWLTESGMPMPHDTWKHIFAVASARCASQDVPIHCHPHMLRHSFALRMLVTLMYNFDRRFGLTPQQREVNRTLFGDPYACVQMLLGHRSRETTESIYLEPVKGLEVERFLNGDGEDDESAAALLSRVAQASSQVLDVLP